ncbi:MULTISPECIES: hypothetical protein [unclassified Nitrobacter]|uniref:hypothetical protein n=1 Tax=unclassified Nitrobacter TaxID=2620411 RepID=UPI00092CA126|nr:MULTISPECIES: hypothetical protein [unclassified Nitrobacter]MBN9146613.1 hypothetical protein [Nitrobacter sp.]OJV04065.1 MAG: hypothetical protein BGO16_08440 [Nitrobacter sp. 62-23]
MTDAVLADLLLRGKNRWVEVRDSRTRITVWSSARSKRSPSFVRRVASLDLVTGGTIPLLQIAFLGFLRYHAVCRLTSNYKISLNFQL